MVSEIGIGTFEADGKPVVEMRHVRVTNIGTPYEGVSTKTGEPYKIVRINMELTLGEGVKRNYFVATAFTKIVEDLTDKGVKKGDIVTIQVDMNVAGKYPCTELRLLNIVKEKL